MRVLAAVLLAAMANPAAGNEHVAATIDARPIARSCAIASTATIVTFDAFPNSAVSYHFVRSDGSFSPTGKLALGGDGAVAQSVRDVWMPHGPAPWVALEILTPQRVRSARVSVARCARAVAAVR